MICKICDYDIDEDLVDDEEPSEQDIFEAVYHHIKYDHKITELANWLALAWIENGEGKV